MGTDFCDEHKQADMERKQAYISTKTKRESTVKGKQLANAHMAHYNAVTRDPQVNSFYHSAQWQHMRDYIYSRDMGMCQVCGNAVTDRKIVDHIHPLKVSNEERLSQDNLWTLCYRCHNIKTQLEESIKQQPNGNTKLKHISKQWWVKAIKERIK
ncbi:HNH endonuclease [Lactiplantibacillus plantarum]|uniref:HNH endonuclease n=1 Tax=Lactiplantibacillus plantarum TaxID=1590 RepID=UPI00284B4A8C|nr:HNH endonuclease [Lactiplantibacillus plantarum]MDR4073131.1 HNH endonuclease [Lactiplantibacillus plantarum]